VALQLKRRGITRVHPLQGGLAQWMALGLPVDEFRSVEATGADKIHPIEPGGRMDIKPMAT